MSDNLCFRCDGSGQNTRTAPAEPCPACEGSGRLTTPQRPQDVPKGDTEAEGLGPRHVVCLIVTVFAVVAAVAYGTYAPEWLSLGLLTVFSAFLLVQNVVGFVSQSDELSARARLAVLNKCLPVVLANVVVFGVGMIALTAFGGWFWLTGLFRGIFVFQLLAAMVGCVEHRALLRYVTECVRKAPVHPGAVVGNAEADRIRDAMGVHAKAK